MQCTVHVASSIWRVCARSLVVAAGDELANPSISTTTTRAGHRQRCGVAMASHAVLVRDSTQCAMAVAVLAAVLSVWCLPVAHAACVTGTC